MDKKISELTETNSLSATDLFVVAKDMGGSVYENRRIQSSNVSPSGVVLQTTDQVIGGIKSFTSPIAGSVTGNAGTVTDGVYTSGDQTVNGTKTFGSFPISPSGYPSTDFEMANKKYVDTNAGLVAWEVITGDTQAVSGRGYFINAVSNTIDLTLPATPTVGQTVNVRAIDSAYTITILRNSSNIESNAEDLVINVGSAGMILTYADSTRGWVLTPHVADIGIGTTNLIYADTTATVGSLYLIDATSNTVALTLPATPIIGWKVRIRVLNSTYAVTIARNGSNIESLAQDMTVNVSNAGFELVYADVARGWVVAQNVANIKQAGEWVLKERKDIVVATQNTTFTGLDGNSKRRYKIVLSLIAGATGDVKTFLQLNSDATASNYFTQLNYSIGTNSAGEQNTTRTGVKIGNTFASGGQNYAEAIIDAKTGKSRTVSYSGMWQSTSNTTYDVHGSGFYIETSVNITEIKFAGDTANAFGIGSYIELWELAQ